jgi:aminoglycoside phosphotransferase family enzyme/predicted kinase
MDAAQSASQEDVFRLLADAETHGMDESEGDKVRRIDTHAAAVFLAGDLVFKVKRAVKYPFLDYSTPDKRKAACLAELEVNRAFAPQLYRRVVPITREASGALALDGTGEPVEWAVEMTRFDENKTLDRLAERGRLSDTLTRKLAAVVAAMHTRAKPVEPNSWIEAVPGFITENAAAFRKHGDREQGHREQDDRGHRNRDHDELFPDHLVDLLEQKSLAAFHRLRPLLAARGAQGLIRRGHGDLHLGNVAILGGETVAFDALEFDPIFASGDLLYDLAFLLMDLVERGLPRAANEVLNGYFAAARRIEDCDGIAALPFFMSLRAAIRAKVTAARLALAKTEDKDKIARAAKSYFKLALDLLMPAKPVIVGTGGLSGTGKSVLARALAPLLPPMPGALVFRSDVERKALFGVAETDRLPPEAYRPEATDRIYAVLNEKAGRVARAGHCAIADAVFAKPQERAALETAATAAGADFHGLFLVADLPSRLARVGGRGPDASDADAAAAQRQEDFAIGDVTWEIIDASGAPDETLAQARMEIARMEIARRQ